MNLFRPLLIVASFHLLSFTACQNHGGGTDMTNTVGDSVFVDSVDIDSDALVLSLTPTVECLPLYYAKEKGIFKTLGLKVCLKTYESQFDCDTAMLGKTAIGGASDLLRLYFHAENGNVLTAVSSLDGKWSLLSSGDLRIKKIPLLKDRMIAVARFSASDYYSEKALRGADMEYGESFRPQINNYYLRTSMLKNHQVDAAVLPEPFATQAKLSGHNVLYESSIDGLNIGCLAFKPSVLTVEDSLLLVKSILKGYNQAVEDINKHGKSVCQAILKTKFRLKQQVIDSLALPKYQKATSPSEDNLQKCRQFMQDRERWSGRVNDELLLNSEIIRK